MALSYMAQPSLAGVGLSAVYRTDATSQFFLSSLSVPALFVGVGSLGLVPSLCLFDRWGRTPHEALLMSGI